MNNNDHHHHHHHHHHKTNLPNGARKLNPWNELWAQAAGPWHFTPYVPDAGHGFSDRAVSSIWLALGKRYFVTRFLVAAKSGEVQYLGPGMIDQMKERITKAPSAQTPEASH
eukprot:3838264-Amphidinium_carterae.2